jgi:hypothetical protein
MEKYYKSSVDIEQSILQEVWTGKVITPMVDFKVLQE